MGLRKTDKGKKSEGLAILLRRDEGEEGGHRAAGVSNYSKGDELNNALRYVLDVESSDQELCSDGGISFAAVREALDERVSTLASESSEGDAAWEESTVGRLGPRVVAVDQTSVFGRLGLSPDGLRLESQGNFSSCRANSCVFAGKWMYEATLGTAGIQQIGWATLGCQFTNEEGVGDASHSYAFDGKRVRKWCVEPEGYGQPWAPGDVIGCCMDLDAGELSFYRNNVSMGVAYPNVSTLQPGLGYFPAISLSHGERCDLNFGGRPFQYPVEGFRPLQLAPPASEIRKSRYLEGCFRRLIEVTGCQSSRHLSPNVMLSKPGLPVDDRVLLAAAIVSPLRLLLESNYHILNFFIPFLREIASQPDHSVPNLMLCLNMLECALGKDEFDRVMTIVVESLSRACGSSTFKPADLPETASYPHLMLMNSLMKCTSIRSLFLGLPNINKLIEGFLTRKQPTAEDLKELLPTVWYKGCKDDTSSEERMATIVTALSSALQKVEQCQFELLKLLLEEDKTSGSKHVLHFFKHLLKANQGASRNVQPPGLSDVSVLVSSFNLLLRLLRPSLMLQSDGHSCLEDFPARELFVDGAVSHERSLHHDLPRLGGLLSYLQKEHPLMVAASIPVHVHLEQDVGVVDGGPPLSQIHLVPHNMVGKLLHILILLYRLGIEAALKMTLHQFQAEAGQRAQLLKLEQKLANSEKNGTAKTKQVDDVQKQREEVVKSVRHCTWYKVVLFMPWKQEGMFLLTVYLAKMLSLLSETSSDLFRYVPEAYVEAMLDLFQAVVKLEPRFADLEHMELLGLQPVISFLVQHFNHPMLVNPQICDALLQGLAALFADKHFLFACECNEHAQKTLVPDLLKAFDTRYWLSISNIFLSIAKGTGFSQSQGSLNSGSAVFRQLLVETCREKPHLLDGFLNRLFNTLNWTVTEMTVTLGEVGEHLERLAMMGRNYNHPDVVRLYRKASVLFNLSINLLRLLELVAWQMPSVFLSGSKLNLTRVVEVIGFVLSHVTVGSDARVFNNVLDAPQSWQEWKSKVSRSTILAPMAGILTSLHKAQKMGPQQPPPQHQGGDRRGREFGGALWGSVGLVSNAVSGAVVGVQRLVMGGSERRANDSRESTEGTHTIAAALAESLSAPPECLSYLNDVEWKLPSSGGSGSSGSGSGSAQSAPSSLSLELREVLDAYKVEVDRRSRSTSLDFDAAESIPEDFLDPIVMTVMEDPVILPDSKITVDRSTIERHLLTQQTDPFSRADLSKDMVIPNRELRARVEQWKSKRLKQFDS
ncbi:hypothetical protein BSKO_06247 [Bryopsis sp. KO-2023]|nr:hypothetical protein BSKO_06247 [Bryopsis sp. KO-2023]